MMEEIFVACDHMLFIKEFEETELHQHMVKHLTIDLDGEMTCELNGERVVAEGYILQSYISHQRKKCSEKSIKMVFLIDESSSLAKSVDEVLGKSPYKILKVDEVERIRKVWQEKHELLQGKENFKKQYDKMIDEIFNICGIKRKKHNVMDERIRKILTLINNEEVLPQMDTICEAVYLSKSRVLHLFKEQVGISYKHYILIKKFLRTWQYLASDENITEAAIHAGFSDAAHYTKFAKNCFGLSTKKELEKTQGLYLVDEYLK